MKRIFGAVLAALALTAAAPDPIVAVRGSDAITASQARALLANADPALRQQAKSDPSVLTGLVRDTLVQRAVLADANAAHWDQNAGVAALLARARDQVVLQTYLAAHAQVPASYPAEADIQAAYDQARAQLMQPRSYHLLQASIAVAAGAAPAAAAEARRRAADIAHQVTRGRATFEAASRAVAGAQVVDLGWQPETHLLPAARDAVAGLLEGQVSAPVCSAAGCAVLQLVATRPAGPTPLAEVRDSLVRGLRQQKQRQLEFAYENALLAKQPVQVNEIELSHLAAP